MNVAVVGFEPAAQVLTALLGARSHRLSVFEKFVAPYGLPRMSTPDGEVARLLQHDAKRVLAQAIPQPQRLDELGVHRPAVVPAGQSGQVVDLDCTYAGYFEQHAVTTLCSRPDLHVFGVARDVEANVALIDDLVAQVAKVAQSRPAQLQTYEALS